jgi:lipid A ethanolaminephosphotransferase
MLKDLAQRLSNIRRDTVLAFHQIGSHGPAYSERYPQSAARFAPACDSNQLQRCTQQEIVNAYDNTIVNTDAFLAAQISMLQHQEQQLDSILLYVSDHGESLGEQGLFLHGMPYAFAPSAQTRVPMLLWTSPGYPPARAFELRMRARSPSRFAVARQRLSHRPGRPADQQRRL